MATINVVKKHHLTHAKARTVAEKMANDLKKRFDLACTWDGDDCRFERSGLTGSMHVGKSDISLDVKLGFLLSAVAPSIERAIHTQLDDLVGEPGAGSKGGGAKGADAKTSAKPAAKPVAKKKPR